MNTIGFLKIINAINSILLPKVCFGCNTHLLDGEHLLCTPCRHDLPQTNYNFIAENPVDRTFYGRVPIEKAVSFLHYAPIGTVKNLLHHLKYKNQEIIGDFLGEWYGNVLKAQGHLPKLDYVIPVPLHQKKLRKRGYNQVDAFGKQLAAHLNAQFLGNVLIKTSNNRTQTQKNRLFRWQSSQDLYVIDDSHYFSNKKILLVDDIITTGATIESCAMAFSKNGSSKIYVAAMAFVPKMGS